MALMDRLRQMFAGAALPAETRSVFARSSSPRDLLRGLEELRLRNEMEMHELEEELGAVEKAQVLEEDRVRKGDLTPTVKTATLRKVERLRKQVATLDARLAIYNENINLHLDLISRVQKVDAMEMRGVGEDQIDDLMEQVNDSVKLYARTQLAGREAGDAPAVNRQAEAERHAALERELLGDAAGQSAHRERRRELE